MMGHGNGWKENRSVFDSYNSFMLNSYFPYGIVEIEMNDFN
jgi:hypothetical protein